MDIPLFKEFNSKTPIDIEVANEVIQLFPLNSRCGSGAKKWCLSIDGVMRKGPARQGLVRFRGKELHGTFENVRESDGVWLVRFETMVPHPAFWGDPE